MLQLQEDSDPGAPAYFLCFNHSTKQAILSVRGTKTPADALTDLVANVQEQEEEDGRKLFAHAGFFTAARSIAAKATPAIRRLLAPMQYSLVVTGHSLGASTAALVTLLLRHRAQAWSSDLALRCVCFAPCPCLDLANAQLCREGAAPLAAPLVTSFVCNDDAVARVSMQNLGRLAMLAKGATVDDVIEVAATKEYRATKDSEIDLLIPGKIVMLHRLSAAESEASSETAIVEESTKTKKQVTSRAPGEWEAWAGDCLSFPELGYLELSPSSIADHMAPVYREAITVAAVAQGAMVEAPPRAAETFPDWLKRAALQQKHQQL